MIRDIRELASLGNQVLYHVEIDPRCEIIKSLTTEGTELKNEYDEAVKAGGTFKIIVPSSYTVSEVESFVARMPSMQIGIAKESFKKGFRIAGNVVFTEELVPAGDDFERHYKRYSYLPGKASRFIQTFEDLWAETTVVKDAP